MSIFGAPVTEVTGLAGFNTNALTTPTFNTNVGDLIIATALGFTGGTVAQVSDVARNEYTIVGPINLTSGTVGFGYVAYCLSATVASSINAITFRWTNTQANFCSLGGWDIPITGGTVLFDTTAGVSGSGNTPTTDDFSTAGSDELVVGLVGNNVGGLSYTATAPWNIVNASFNNGTSALFDGTFSSPQTNITASVEGNSGDFAIFIGAFMAAPTSWSTSGNAGHAGATVGYSGTASGQVTADGSGNYTIPGLSNGPYTITPSLVGYTFSPTSRSETVSSSDITGVDFIATAIPAGVPGTGENIISAGYGLGSNGSPTWMQSPKTAITGTNIGTRIL